MNAQVAAMAERRRRVGSRSQPPARGAATAASGMPGVSSMDIARRDGRFVDDATVPAMPEDSAEES